MSWYRTGTVAVTNGSKTVTGVGTLFTTAVNVGDAFALVDANLNPTGAWYEVDVVVSNTEITLKQSYAGTTGSNNQYCVFNMVGNMTTPSFAQRLATFFASFQSLIEKPTTTPTAASIPVADANSYIDSGWIKDASTTVKGVIELATSAEVLAGTDNERAVTPAGLLAGFPTRLRSNLLGTVSQTGGVPTGAVIESGSNANGYYIKFADGTMACRGVGRQDNPTRDLVITDLYMTVMPVTFAAEFISKPTVISCGLEDSNNLGFGGGRTIPTTTTGTSLTYWSKSSAPTYCISNYIVIGRWY